MVDTTDTLRSISLKDPKTGLDFDLTIYPNHDLESISVDVNVTQSPVKVTIDDIDDSLL